MQTRSLAGTIRFQVLVHVRDSYCASETVYQELEWFPFIGNRVGNLSKAPCSEKDTLTRTVRDGYDDVLKRWTVETV
jgi:hypothetical protein